MIRRSHTTAAAATAAQLRINAVRLMRPQGLRSSTIRAAAVAATTSERRNCSRNGVILSESNSAPGWVGRCGLRGSHHRSFSVFLLADLARKRRISSYLRLSRQHHAFAATERAVVSPVAQIVDFRARRSPHHASPHPAQKDLERFRQLRPAQVSQSFRQFYNYRFAPPDGSLCGDAGTFHHRKTPRTQSFDGKLMLVLHQPFRQAHGK